MNKYELYVEVMKLAPYEEATEDYRGSLSVALKKFTDAVRSLDEEDRPANWDAKLKKMEDVVKKLKLIALNSYKGLPSTAYSQLSYMMGKQIPDDLAWKSVVERENFYRMRTFTDRRNGIEFKEMFHVPITMRRQVGTERYSIPGYPCLYLGKSSYVCWEEMGRPQMSSCWCSRLVNREQFEVLDLRLPSEKVFCNENEIARYMMLFPLIISCMIPMKGESCDVFKPEYLIPQLIMEWVIKNSKTGIYYTTTHYTSQTRKDFDYPRDKFDNLAIPIQSPLERDTENCPVLAGMFKITNPANDEIEALKHGRDIDGGNMDADQIEENYRTSPFGVLERYLCDEGEFGLHELN